KLTLVHGCYWKKCSFCDVTLDYIGRYELSPIKILVDRIEKIVRETKQTGFHFVDEAAPPNLLKELAIELIKRKIAISWWTNIRFEKSFSDDLCFLLAKSGCIAVSGGLEVASDRLLEKMKKGVTVEQVASVTNAFTNAGIMVHAYLMFGFPTQTEQETIDSLERVRQLFEAGIIHSGFWHRFSLTAHSPIAKNPEEFEVKIIGPKKGTFAWNDLVHEDAKGCKHGFYAKGLEKAIFNFMHGIGFDKELDFWFDFKVPKPKVQKNLVQKSLLQLQKTDLEKFQSKVLWLGNLPEIEFYFVETKRKKMTKAKLTFFERAEDFQLKVSEEVGKWLLEILAEAVPESEKFLSLKDLSETFPNNFTEFLASETWEILREKGLVLV
ncbi:radical SAM protein, partial [bacterium]|nr:radical SAM protein [bacterium]